MRRVLKGLGLQSLPETLHLCGNPLVHGGIDDRIDVLAHIVAVHNDVRASFHQLILGVPYTLPSTVRAQLLSGDGSQAQQPSYCHQSDANAACKQMVKSLRRWGAHQAAQR